MRWIAASGRDVMLKNLGVSYLRRRRRRRRHCRHERVRRGWVDGCGSEGVGGGVKGGGGGVVKGGG